MVRFFTITVILLGLATSVGAAPLGETRSVHQSAKSDFGRLLAARSTLDQAHESLATEIETLKSARRSQLAPAVEDATLDARLRRAKAMAAELADLDRRVTQARKAYVDARVHLVTALESEILGLQLSLSEVNQAERLARFEVLRRLVEERRTLPNVPAPRHEPVVLPAPPTGVVVSAEELRELVDETRDHAERVQEQLAQITARVEALRQRRRLLQVAMDFQRDDSLFAEDERNRRVVTETREGLPTVLGPVRASAPDTAGSAPPASLEMPQANSRPEEEASGGGDSPGEPAGARSDGDGAQSESDSADPGDADTAESGEPEVGNSLGIDDQGGPSPSLASPHLGQDGGDSGSDRMIRLGAAFDPDMLEGDVDSLSPSGVEQQIRALLVQRGKLVEKRQELSHRQQNLERRAADAD